MDNDKPKLKYENIEKTSKKNLFKKEIIEYKEPSYLPNNITYYPLDIKEINDFSNLDSNLKMSDYKLSLSNDISEKDLLKLNNKKFQNYPKKL